MPLPKELQGWLQAAFAAVPPQIQWLCIEWNDGHSDGQKVHCFNACGLTTADFDPEDPDSLEALEDPDWEYPPVGAIPWIASGDRTYAAKLKRQFAGDERNIAAFLQRGGRIALGLHESDLDVYPAAGHAPVAGYYYELSPTYTNNFCHSNHDGLNDLATRREVYRGGRLDWPMPPEATFHVVTRGKPKDLLCHSYWVVCSERLCRLIQAATPHCQVFPIRLYQSPEPRADKMVPGYFAVHLYEQLSCLDPRDVRPPRWVDDLPTFDAAKGYRILKSVVQDREIFRIAYEYRRLVVSSAFRSKLEELGITGTSWLRRTAI